jgi:peptidoglycan/LPS O-acetylase OafA/YrhL
VRTSDPRQNNFDLLRLFAASQVVWQHAQDHLALTSPPAIEAILSAIPGVPIFFVISGFLISMSYERSARDGATLQYFINRFLRIYPGLWVAFAVSVLTVLVFGSLTLYHARAGGIVPWIAGQLTFVQFDNPDFLRHYGTGVLNGSLWTIPVELEFYVLLPLIYLALRLRDREDGRWRLVALLVAGALFNLFFTHIEPAHAGALWFKLLKVTVVPYLYMFLVGVVIQRNMDILRRVIVGKAAAWGAIYVVACFVGLRFGVTVGYNDPFPLLMALLGILTISCAYSAGHLAERILRGNDISYGVYVYHMVVMNAVIAAGGFGPVAATLLTLGVTYALAAISWIAVERPALSLKSYTIRVVGPAAARSV